LGADRGDEIPVASAGLGWEERGEEGECVAVGGEEDVRGCNDTPIVECSVNAPFLVLTFHVAVGNREPHRLDSGYWRVCLYVQSVRAVLADQFVPQ
jgi:hypothetical protein